MKKEESKTQIAGQAVLEGVMMQGKTAKALAVRAEDGRILIHSERIPPKSRLRKVPFIRGILNLFDSLVKGTGIILKSAEVAVEGVDTNNGKGMGIMMAGSVLLGFLLAAALFIVLPTALTEWIFHDLTRMAKLAIDAALKILIIIGYFLAVSRMKDIKRLFMYHGAEHKTITCYEKGLDLTVENVRGCSKHHDRCGTSFVVYVLFISIIVMMLTGLVAELTGFDAYFDKIWVRSLIKLALLPLVASISYELIMLFARFVSPIVKPMKWLGQQMQKITTQEPDDSMIEVAIVAHKTVQEMDNDMNVPETHFPEPITLGEFRKEAERLLEYKTIESSDIDWILCAVLGLKRNQLKENVKIPVGYVIKIKTMLERCAKGEPLQYVLGNTEFYGLLFKVEKGVLIPRMETELLCEKTLEYAKEGRKKILDLCCGSGVIGITVHKMSKNYVTCSDISDKAIELTRANAKYHDADVNIVKGNMLEPFNSKFDIIVCNPPYIPTSDIQKLDKKVKDHEPHLALDGGEDGLEFYRYLAKNAPRKLYKDGRLLLEIGIGQSEAVSNLLKDNFDIEEIKKDYNGIDRIIVAKVK